MDPEDEIQAVLDAAMAERVQNEEEQRLAAEAAQRAAQLAQGQQGQQTYQPQQPDVQQTTSFQVMQQLGSIDRVTTKIMESITEKAAGTDAARAQIAEIRGEITAAVTEAVAQNGHTAESLLANQQWLKTMKSYGLGSLAQADNLKVVQQVGELQTPVGTSGAATTTNPEIAKLNRKYGADVVIGVVKELSAGTPEGAQIDPKAVGRILAARGE